MARSNIVPFRVRPGRDDDIIEALAAIPKMDRSEAIRAALRVYFNLGNTVQAFKGSKLDLPGSYQPLKLEGISLIEVERSADDIDDAIDNLLGDF